jgi:two-component system, OmpR family, KDP operon response regulator KdpE
MTTPRILIVDDEPQILRFMKPALKAGGFEPLVAENAADAIRLAATQAPDLIILDLGLPDRDGKDVISAIRNWSQVPIIVLSARDRETEKVQALDLGADDYVSKPFGISELLARVRAGLRHRKLLEARPQVHTVAGVTIDNIKHEVMRDGVAVHLTPKEFDLLNLLISNHDKLLTHRHILGTVWGPAHVEDVQYLRVLIKQLRGKIEANAESPALIITEPGLGYRFHSGQ